MTAPTSREETPWTPTTNPAPRFRQHVDGRWAVYWPALMHWQVFVPAAIDMTDYYLAVNSQVHGKGWSEAVLVGLPQFEELDRVRLTDLKAAAREHALQVLAIVAELELRTRTAVEAGDPR